MDRLEPPDLREQVLLHEESASQGLRSGRSAPSIGLSSLHGWRLDPADQLRRFLVELNRLELASQLVFVIKLMGPRLHRSISKSEPLKRLSPSPLWVLSSSS
ncbi:hypothetical protein FCV25MIE_34843 [Fagus crenata]